MEALASHSRFFDHLVDLVPAKYYLSAGSEEMVNLKYMKKSARDEAKAAFKQQYKAAKRSKLDPDQAKGTFALQKEAAAREQQERQQQNGQAAGDSEDDSDDDEGEESGSDEEEDAPRKRRQSGQQAQQGGQQQGAAGTAVGQLAISSKPASREELKERLQKKLEDMRKQRKAEEQAASARDAKEWRDKSLQEGRKKVTGQKRKAAGSVEQQQAAAAKAAASPAGGQQQQKQQKKGQQGEGDANASLTFNKLDFGSDPQQQKKKPRKQSKQQLLEAAQDKQAAAPELAATQEGKAQLQKEAWGAALQRAKGDKVLDDPRLLKKSLKKEAKLKAKKTAAWQDRLKHQAGEQHMKQKKRRDNIDTRVKAKQDKKKQKRENKLMRAGFEGRKQGFIDTPKKPAA